MQLGLTLLGLILACIAIWLGLGNKKTTDKRLKSVEGRLESVEKNVGPILGGEVTCIFMGSKSTPVKPRQKQKRDARQKWIGGEKANLPPQSTAGTLLPLYYGSHKMLSAGISVDNKPKETREIQPNSW